jgi:PEP-CTERM motif
MKYTLKLGALLAVFIIFSAIPAHADSGPTLDYTLSGGPVSATWSMSENPTPFYVEDGTAFAVNSTDLVMDGASVEDIICFFNWADWGGVNSLTYLPDLVGAQLYAGPEDSPTMQTGTFYLTDELTGNCYTLTVTQAPEPMSLLLLASGLAALALMRKKALAN